MSDEHWDHFLAERTYHALLSQGKYCPQDRLETARINADVAYKKLNASRTRHNVIAALITAFVACVSVVMFIYYIV